jgi:hypothetical protein
MSSEKKTAWESATLLILCSLVALGALGIIVWVVATGMFPTLDGLLLTAACLVFALAFGGNVAWSFHTCEAQSILKELSKSSKEHSE